MTKNAKKTKRLIVGISGASGIAFGWRIMELLQSMPVETHLVVSPAAEMTLALEMDKKIADLRAMADVNHPFKDIAAPIASGSFKTDGMIIAPCSVKTMSEIASGITQSLLTRAADVILKERRKLYLMVRESPLHLGHLRTMSTLSEIGATIAPPVPALYAKPDSLDDMITHTAARALDHFDLECDETYRWKD